MVINSMLAMNILANSLNKKKKSSIKLLRFSKICLEKKLLKKTHNEDAYKLTAPKKLINYNLIKTLSID